MYRIQTKAQKVMPTRNVVLSIKHQKKENSPRSRCLPHTQALESFPVTRNLYVNYFGLEIFPLKNSATRFWTSGFLHGPASPTPKPLIIPLGRVEFFRKFAEIFAAQGAPRCR
jgi:hypothetical protein